MVFAGVPPGHFQCRQGQRTCVGRHQGFALFAVGGHAAVADFVAQQRLVGVTAQAGDFGGWQRRQLGAGQAFGTQGDVAGQRVANLHLQVARVGVPVLFQGQAAGR
ncbi:hypothetical protein D3C71_1794420 [compost metagenome]